MSVAITAQAPVASSPSTDSLQAARGTGSGTGSTSEQGLVDFFAKTRADVANGNLEEATKSVASSGEMLGKLREFIDKSAQSDASNRATKAKQRAAAAEAKMELASLDTLGSLGSLGNLSSLSRSSSIGQSGSFGQLASLNQFNSASLPPGPASGPFGGGLGLPGMEKGHGVAMVDKMTNDVTDGAIHRMWVQVVGHATNSVTKNVMALLKGQ
jgi:hypothetical protein